MLARDTLVVALAFEAGPECARLALAGRVCAAAAPGGEWPGEADAPVADVGGAIRVCDAQDGCALSMHAAMTGTAIEIGEAEGAVGEVAQAVAGIVDRLTDVLVARSVGRSVGAADAVSLLGIDVAVVRSSRDCTCIDDCNCVAGGQARARDVGAPTRFQEPSRKLEVALGTARATDRKAIVVELAGAQRVARVAEWNAA